MANPHRHDREAARRWAEALLRRSDWVLLDTETTGTDKRAEVIQVGVLSSDGRRLLDTLIRPKRRIPLATTEIHGITDSMVADAPTYPDVHPRLEELLRGQLVIAYNAAYDQRLLEQTAARYGLAFPDLCWDCAMIQYSRFVGQRRPGYEGYTYQKLPRGQRHQREKHGAIGDCALTLECIRLMAKRHPWWLRWLG
jgi:DNA polymerase-3 subunit epsilon